jgi:hypothetical protein
MFRDQSDPILAAAECELTDENLEQIGAAK